MTMLKKTLEKMPKKSYTTGEVARLFGISQRTVVNYCNSGRIKAQQSPITRYRRISREALLAFLRENGLPTELLGAPTSGSRR